MHEAIIDLDRPSSAEFEAGPHRPLHPHWSKLTAALVVLGICLSTLTRGGLPGKDPVQFLSHLSVSRSEGLFLYQGMIIVSEGLGLTAYLPDGTMKWHLPGDAAGSKMMTQPMEGLLILSSERPGSQGAEAFSVAVDVHTGKQVWSGEGWANISKGYLIAVKNDQSFQVVELKTLRQTFAMPAQRATAVDIFGDSVVVLAHNGVVRSYSLATGAPEDGPVHVDIPGDQQAYLNPGPVQILVEFMQQGGEGTDYWPMSRVALDRKTFAVTYNIIDYPEAIERDCGPVICVQTFTPEGGSIEVISRDRAALWSLPAGAWAEWREEGLLRSASPQGLALVDPRDGSVVTDLAGWEVLDTAMSGSPNGPMLLSQVIKGRLHLAVVGQRGLMPLGSIQSTVSDCQFESPLLVCNTQDGQIGVWTVAHTR